MTLFYVSMKLDLYRCTHDDNFFEFAPLQIFYKCMQRITHDANIAVLQIFLYDTK